MIRGLEDFALWRAMAGLEFLIQRLGHQQDAGLAKPKPAQGCHTAHELTEEQSEPTGLTLTTTSQGPHHEALAQLVHSHQQYCHPEPNAKTTCQDVIYMLISSTCLPRKQFGKSRETNAR